MTGDASGGPSSNLELVQSIYAAWGSGDFSSAALADLGLAADADPR